MVSSAVVSDHGVMWVTTGNANSVLFWRPLGPSWTIAQRYLTLTLKNLISSSFESNPEKSPSWISPLGSSRRIPPLRVTCLCFVISSVSSAWLSGGKYASEASVCTKAPFQDLWQNYSMTVLGKISLCSPGRSPNLISPCQVPGL